MTRLNFLLQICEGTLKSRGSV